ncbi:GNAT family N-acetyltransferase [Ktedonobacteria bacterium brp13]|nr:GNAT family N-acetyltransferase [Ktedonobacteria bacterium brp13]
MDMTEKPPTTKLVIRIAQPEDISHIEHLDSFSASPTRDIHREVHKYFGSVDPSTHEQTLIFLLEEDGTPIGKAELMIPPHGTIAEVGYVKRVIIHPEQRGKGYARTLLRHVIHYAQQELALHAVDLHVYDQNASAINLYESLGFKLQHKELYYRLPL